MSAGGYSADAVVIGGGFYGCVIAVYLARQRGFQRVVLVERESQLLTRASYNNQARVHNGYHYPRSFTTAYRSRVNLPRFVQDWSRAVRQDFVKLYAIARRNSKINGKQFQRFCNDIGARLLPVDSTLRSLFEPRLIEDVFLAEEYTFDAKLLAEWADQELRNTGVEIRFRTEATAISRSSARRLLVTTRDEGNAESSIASRYVFNCAYSGLNRISGDFPGVTTPLKQEITEMALIQVPRPLENIGITVMDGPFFSVMPFPDRALHTLSHVRYTPHCSWADTKETDPYLTLQRYNRDTRYDRMIRDVRRYMPSMGQAKYVDSLFEVKTVLLKNESDDGRPILLENHPHLPGCYSVLGGKIDNVYDIVDKLENELV
jgi:glycine/D-amino acid oxidase-like deaminating enzyme